MKVHVFSNVQNKKIQLFFSDYYLYKLVRLTLLPELSDKDIKIYSGANLKFL
ncbi:hypothetical protein SAMN04489761_1480 [Tenacibaculum sp. MAR_2009_124]|uniref:hypothetical protein n=1 Tax=Tenacibaculum sp. MAR_2009_124 TaxID=1250059 RepID=UPI0008945F57|nr:hypothetical protein [Tenacibaculum sp. MAR_2009_124]SEB69575.1 hypothetical protein SAMN04489761_1480 [Tenacibaculum sp. MAR_2009_124]